MDKCVFIIDDDSVDREFFSIMLPLFGFRVKSADSPQQGLRLLRDFVPDLILIDNHIEEINSFELVRQIKENDEYSPIRVVPIILLSNSDDPESKLAGYEIGVEDFFVKPYNFLEILTRIKALMRAQDLTEQLLQREHRMTLIESLNDSLIYFSKNLRPPMLDLIAKSNLLLSTYSENNYSQIIEFCKQVKANAELTISTLDRLEGRVHELLSKDQQLKSSQLTPQALEEQYRSHFIRHQEQFLRLHDTPQEDSCYGDSQK